MTRKYLFAALLVVAVTISGCYYTQEENTVSPTEPPPPESLPSDGACFASFSWEATPGTLNVSFLNQSSPTRCNHAQWTFGDGTGSSREYSPTHAYVASGSYVARLTICPDENFADPQCGDTSHTVVVPEP